MKLSRDFLWGIGAGLILSALLILGADSLRDQADHLDKQQSLQEETNKEKETDIAKSGTNQDDTTKDDTTKDDATKDDAAKGEDNPVSKDPQAQLGDQNRTDQNPVTDPPAEPAKEVSVTIPSGATSEDVAVILQNHGLIEDSVAFNEYILAQNQATRLRSGTFTLRTGWSEGEILDRLIMNY